MVQNKNLATFVKKLSNSPKNEYDGNSFVLELANTEVVDNVERIESLNEGDALRLNLLRVNEKNVCQICDEDNKEIGVLSAYAEMIAQLITDNIIDIVSIVAKNVVPVSKRKKGSKKALVSVKITFDELEDEVSTVKSATVVEDVRAEAVTEEDIEVSDALAARNFEKVVAVEDVVANFEPEHIVQEAYQEETKIEYAQSYDVAEDDNVEINVYEAAEAIEDKVVEYETVELQEEVAEVETFAMEALQEEKEDFVAEYRMEEQEASQAVVEEEVPEIVEPVQITVMEPAFEEPLPEKYVEPVVMTFENIPYVNPEESVRCEIKQIIDEGIWDTDEYLNKERVECAPLNRALSKALNVLKINRIDNEEILMSVIDSVLCQLEKMYMYIENVNNKAIEYANALGYIEGGANNHQFNVKYNMVVSLIQDDDSNILKISEGIDKLWNVIPKKKRMEDLIERCMKVATRVSDISKQVITLLDINSAPYGTLKYVSAGLIADSYYKWQSAYEYLPFVKEKKHQYYLEELAELTQGFERTKKHYEAMKSEKEDLLNTIRDERIDCEEQLASLGIFAFSTKKYCRERIFELEKEEERAKEELDGIVGEYDKLVREMERKIENVKTKVAWYSAR